MRIRRLAAQGAAYLLVLALVGAAGRAAAQEAGAEAPRAWAAEDEVFYQVLTRSFRDSDGDGIGDLRGIEQSLGYLQRLGVTSILLTPIAPSPFYHNYFATDFAGVEPKYGGLKQYRSLVRAVHARGMKIYLDQEFQYVAEGHPWWKESEGKPGSRYSRFIPYDGPGNTKAASAVYDLTRTPTWNGDTIGLATVNLKEPAVIAYFQELLAMLADPNHDGRFEDGVDGFRLDHMMDDLDYKHRWTNLFADFWAPILARARAVNPRLRIIAEQADWGYGEDFLARSGGDLVFAFPLRGAIAGLNRDSIARALEQTVAITPAGKGQVVFIENHDVPRFATLAGDDARKARLGAALGVLLKGTPLLYYGQELGMRGKRHDDWTADGNDIPDREAFEWTRKVEGPGAALWYKGPGPWWTDRFARDDDGISVEEEQDDPASLLAFYRRLLTLRRTRPELLSGDQRVLPAGEKNVLAVLRSTPEQASLLLLNLGAAAAEVAVDPALLGATPAGRPLVDLVSGAGEGSAERVALPPWGLKLLAVRPAPGVKE